MAHDVFVSYSSKDKTAADAVVAAMESAGIRCWVAPRDILIGQEWAGSILHAIENSRVMVLVFSDHSNNSTHVRKEVERAVHHGLAVAPIRLTQALPANALEYFLSSSHWLDAITPPLDQHLAELTRKVKLLLGGEASSPIAPPRQAMAAAPSRDARKKKGPLAGVVAAIMLIVIVGGLVLAVKMGWLANHGYGRSSATAPVPSKNGVIPSAVSDIPGSTTPANATAQAQTINVATADELIQAIGPDRTIMLKPGEYVLTDVTDQQKEFVRWDRKDDGKSITIRNVKNLSIIGTGVEPVRLIVRASYVFVLNFEKCQEIHLANLTMGHAPKKGECTCGVVGANDCTGVAIEKCDLFGCGAEGLTLANVRKFSFIDSTVRDCSDGIMTIGGCTNLTFSRSHFTGNSQYWGIRIDDSKGVSFSDCNIENNNLTDGSIFQVTSSTDVNFEGGLIENNHASAMMEEADTVTITNASTENNDLKRH